MTPRFVRRAACAIALLALALPASVQAQVAPAALPTADRPFGTLREQAALQQAWLKKRLDTFLPALMRKHGVDMWVVPMREYNEDPVFSSITAPKTFAARRRTIYVFFDKCAAAGTPPSRGVRRADRARRHVAGRRVRRAHVDEERRRPRSAAAQAELWGDEQWQAAQGGGRGAQAEGRSPSIARRRSPSATACRAASCKGMSEALGPAWTSRSSRDAERLPLELIASRLPEEEAFFEKMTALVWQMTETMFSDKVIVPGTTRTSDLVWWWRQRTNDLGLGTWFQPCVEVQRKGVDAEASSATIRSSSRATCCTATSASPSRA